MSSMSGRSLNANEKKLLDDNGVVGIGSELLEYDPEYKGIIEYLLGRVLFVEKLEDGIAISKKCNYSLKIVSLDGDVLNPGGSMTGGSLNNFNTKLLGRQREIEELSVEIKALEEEYKSLSSKKESLKLTINDLEIKNEQIWTFDQMLGKIVTGKITNIQEDKYLEALVVADDADTLSKGCFYHLTKVFKFL